MTSIQGIGIDEAVDCTDGRSWIFSIVGVEIVCCGVADGISKCSKHTPVCVTPPTHISVPCVILLYKYNTVLPQTGSTVLLLFLFL